MQFLPTAKEIMWVNLWNFGPSVAPVTATGFTPKTFNTSPLKADKTDESCESLLKKFDHIRPRINLKLRGYPVKQSKTAQSKSKEFPIIKRFPWWPLFVILVFLHRMEWACACACVSARVHVRVANLCPQKSTAGWLFSLMILIIYSPLNLFYFLIFFIILCISYFSVLSSLSFLFFIYLFTFIPTDQYRRWVILALALSRTFLARCVAQWHFAPATCWDHKGSSIWCQKRSANVFFFRSFCSKYSHFRSFWQEMCKKSALLFRRVIDSYLTAITHQRHVSAPDVGIWTIVEYLMVIFSTPLKLIFINPILWCY